MLHLLIIFPVFILNLFTEFGKRKKLEKETLYKNIPKHNWTGTSLYGSFPSWSSSCIAVLRWFPPIVSNVYVCISDSRYWLECFISLITHIEGTWKTNGFCTIFSLSFWTNSLSTFLIRYSFLGALKYRTGIFCESKSNNNNYDTYYHIEEKCN